MCRHPYLVPVLDETGEVSIRGIGYAGPNSSLRLLLAVAGSLPPVAVVSSDWQSVIIFGMMAFMLVTSCRAHPATGAAAVEHQNGGLPLPTPSKLPESATTTMPKPVALYSIHFPRSRDPSKYHAAPSSLL